MTNIFWKAYSSNDRYVVIDNLQSVIGKFGDLIDFKLFSDISINLTIEIDESKIDGLYDELRNHIGLDSFKYLHSTIQKERTIYLNITFAKGTGNLKQVTLAVPG